MQNNRVDVCIIEDDAAQRAQLLRWLLRHQHSAVEAATADDGLQLIYQARPRIVICDLMLPEQCGIDICKRIRGDETLDGTYFILVTACEDRAKRRDAFNAGVDEYMVKPLDAEEVAAQVRNGLRVNHLQERLQRAALTDGLTGLWNHGHFRHLLDREFQRVRRYHGAVSLLMLDLDHFKAVNDTYGHEVGNLVLRAVARQLAAQVRDIDIVARYGGEEFAVICPETDLEAAYRLADRMRGAVSAEVRIPRYPQINLTVSVGVASSSDGLVHSVSDLINEADRALYESKRRGRNQVTRADSLSLHDISPGVVQIGEVDRLQKQVVSLSMQAKELCLQSVWVLVQALEARDRFAAWHSRNTRFYADRMSETAGWTESLRTALSNAAMLHDLGKIGVPDHLLGKPGPYTESESAILRQVPLLTCKILEPLRVFETEILIVRHLRERVDGAGYPDRLGGNSIPIGSRLLAIAEAFDALTSDRAHRARHSIDDTVDIIRNSAGTQFDPQLVALLERVLSAERDVWEDQISRARAECPTDEATTPAAIYGL